MFFFLKKIKLKNIKNSIENGTFVEEFPEH